PEPLLDILDELGEADDEEGLKDLGNEVLPRLVRDGDVRESRFEGYWRDVGTIESYFEAHQDLLDGDPPLELDDPAWPILTQASARARRRRWHAATAAGHRGAVRVLGAAAATRGGGERPGGGRTARPATRLRSPCRGPRALSARFRRLQ